MNSHVVATRFGFACLGVGHLLFALTDGPPMALSFRPSASSTDPQNALTFSQPSSSRNVYSFRNSQPPPKPAPTLDLPALQDASRVLQDQFAKDARLVPDLGESLTVRACNSCLGPSALLLIYILQLGRRLRSRTVSLQMTLAYSSRNGGSSTFQRNYGHITPVRCAFRVIQVKLSST